jgi:formylglycine-generating enzyme required for sulfatase activity
MMITSLGEIQFRSIPAGTFRMGGSMNDKFVTDVEMPSHEVMVTAFLISVHPVTWKQWNQVTNQSANFDDLPVTGVSFQEATEFARSLDARLPTEAEWEYACRASSSSLFPHGARLEHSHANYLYDESGEEVGCGGLTPVGTYAPNDFGLHDMIGNVCEWTADLWHPSYVNAPCDGSAWIAGGQPAKRVIRGGAWDQLPRTLRASWRDWAPESARWDNLGFRLARDL